MAQKSTLRRAVFNVAGVYRILWRPFSNTVLIARALVEEWVWGMEPVTELIGRAHGRQLPALLRAMGATVGAEVDLRHPLTIHNPQDRLNELSIGAQTHVGKDCLFDLTGPITIENNATLSMRTTLITHFDAYLSPLRLKTYPSQHRGVVIEEGAYIGANATILMGVHIGRCAMVGAGALVREDVPPYTVVAGVPARVIRQLDPHEVEPDHE